MRVYEALAKDEMVMDLRERRAHDQSRRWKSGVENDVRTVFVYEILENQIKIVF